MNYSTAIFLGNPDVIAVKARWQDPDNSTNRNLTKEEWFKTFDRSLKRDDIIIVPTPSRIGFTTAKVLSIEPSIDLDHPEEVRWIVGKVDLSEYQRVIDTEALVIEKIKRAEFQKRRKELMANLAEEGDAEQIKMLAKQVEGTVVSSTSGLGSTGEPPAKG